MNRLARWLRDRKSSVTTEKVVMWHVGPTVAPPEEILADHQRRLDDLERLFDENRAVTTSVTVNSSDEANTSA